jgi:hypothetical protein
MYIDTMSTVIKYFGVGSVGGSALPRPGRPGRSARRYVAPRASDDEDMVPILSGRRKKGFTEKEYAQLKKPKLLGKNTSIGEELELLRDTYLKAEMLALEQQERQVSENWDGDVYIGSNVNTLSVLYGIMMVCVIGGLVFAVASRGTLWAVDPNYYSSSPPPLW